MGGVDVWKMIQRSLALFAALSWVYFSIHTVNSIIHHYGRATSRVNEAGVIMNTVCSLPQKDLSNKFVDCEEIHDIMYGSAPIMIAFEDTATQLMREMFFQVKHEAIDVVHSLGLVFFVVAVAALGILAYIMRSFENYNRQRDMEHFSIASKSRNQHMINIGAIAEHMRLTDGNIRWASPTPALGMAGVVPPTPTAGMHRAAYPPSPSGPSIQEIQEVHENGSDGARSGVVSGGIGRYGYDALTQRGRRA